MELRQLEFYWGDLIFNIKGFLTYGDDESA